MRKTVRILGIEGPDIHLEGASITGWSLAAQLQGATHVVLVVGDIPDGALSAGCTGLNPYDEPKLRALVDPEGQSNETERLSVLPVQSVVEES